MPECACCGEPAPESITGQHHCEDCRIYGCWEFDSCQRIANLDGGPAELAKRLGISEEQARAQIERMRREP